VLPTHSSFKRLARMHTSWLKWVLMMASVSNIAAAFSLPSWSIKWHESFVDAAKEDSITSSVAGSNPASSSSSSSGNSRDGIDGTSGISDETAGGVKTVGLLVAIWFVLKVAGFIAMYFAYRWCWPWLFPRHNVELSEGPDQSPQFWEELLSHLGLGNSSTEKEAAVELDSQTGRLKYNGVLYARVAQTDENEDSV